MWCSAESQLHARGPYTQQTANTTMLPEMPPQGGPYTSSPKSSRGSSQNPNACLQVRKNLRCTRTQTYSHESTPAMKTSPAPPIKSIENASNLRSVASILSSLPTRDINPNNNTRPQIHHPDRLNPNLHHHNHDVAQVPPRPYLPLRVRHRCSHRHPCHHSLPL